MAAAGIVLLLLGFRKEMTRYIQKETVPVVNETAQEIKPAIAAMASAVKEGISERRVCECGAENGAESKFCRVCGKPLAKACPQCGAELPADSAFCDKCGKKL